MNAVEIFKPGIAELRGLAEKYRGLTIAGPDDAEGYERVKAAKKELADWRITITKAGKTYRQEALDYQREVIRQEKEHLDAIVPVEDALKAQLEAVDEARKREERRALLPDRVKLLAEIEVVLPEEEILALDEKEFTAFFNEKKLALLESREAERVAKEAEARRAAELEKAKAEAAAKAVEEERLRAEREEAAKKAEAERIEREKAEELARAEKNRRYKAWLKEQGVDTADPSVKVERVGTKFELWRKVSEIEIA